MVGVSTSVALCVGGGSDSDGSQYGSIVNCSRGLDVSVSEQAVKQLFDTVKSLCATVANLTNDMRMLRMENVGHSNANPVNTTESESFRLAIREEVKEMEEREKRKSSIVVKGLEEPCAREFWKGF